MTLDTRRPLAAVALSLALGSALASCARRATEEVESETVVTVKTEAAATGDIRGVIHATGLVSPAPGAELVVVAPEPARVAEVPHAVGDRVRRGDVLVRFEIPSSAAEVQKQQAEVVRAQATLESANAARTRAGELFERGVAARREVEEATRAVADAQAALAQAQAALAASRTLAARSVVRATFDGLVARRLHNPGDLVEASASDPVLRVIDPRHLEIVASVPLSDAPRVQPGAAGRIAATDTMPEIALKVVSRPAAVEAGTATIPVRLALGATSNIPAGTPVEIEIDAEAHKGAVLVPAVAIVREGEETAVFVAADGKAHRRAIKIGLSDGGHVEIVSGVKAGEMVVVDGQAGLPDGAAITTAAEDAHDKEPAAGAARDKEKDAK
jgi:RND family efflux transporter MFP subunit